MIFFNDKCQRVLIQNVTVQNPPIMHFVFKGGGGGNITFQNMTINTTASNAKNTDGVDLVGTNCLFQNCTINAGDDNIALGSSSASAYSSDILVTNCAFGVGHGVSIGSNTAGSVSNLTVINCTFNGTDYGIRMKSSTNSSGGAGEGGIAQNLSYLNLGMTNIVDGAIVIYSYYDSSGEFGTPTGVTPYFASTQAVSTATVPVWRNVIISNVTATVASGGVPGIIWGRMEEPATNIIFSHVSISANQSFDVYNANNIQFVDSKITVPSGTTSFQLFNAQVIITNDSPTTNFFTLNGLTTNGYVNKLAFYNAEASLQNTNVLALNSSVTLGAATFTVSNNFALSPSNTLNFVLGTSNATIPVVGNLVLDGTNNITAGDGFTNGTYTLLTYTGNLAGNLPTLGTTPAGYTSSAQDQRRRRGQSPRHFAAAGRPDEPARIADEPRHKPDMVQRPPTRRVTTSNARRPTAALISSSPTRQPRIIPTRPHQRRDLLLRRLRDQFRSRKRQFRPGQRQAAALVRFNQHQFPVVSGQMQLSWPQDHLGWQLQIQTNSLNKGLGTNWVTVANSTNVDQMNISVSPTNGSVFLRLVYP